MSRSTSVSSGFQAVCMRLYFTVYCKLQFAFKDFKVVFWFFFVLFLSQKIYLNSKRLTWIVHFRSKLGTLACQYKKLKSYFQG